ncbi:probable WRKY transcription factor 50 isoform X2 [Malania oleifera]|uniref:probable WRKY transcription factor 50 isoform X2 n=1 Tax=Malania oleifera TaxID=397392 RepID=UPI0025AE2112|nr:probable WRKY transcription factor 50 isoform X2 [Malania oleifera]
MNLPNGLSPYLLHPYSSAAVPTFPPNHPYPAAAPPDCSYASMDGLDCSDYFNPSSDYLMPAMDDDSSSSFNTTSPTQMDSSAAPANSFFSTASGDSSLSSSDHMSCNGDLKRTMEDVGCRIAFRTRSELEVMDDGYKWRKYGKKAVKNSPNPRM